MKLQPLPFANAIAVTTAGLTIVLYTLRWMLPPFFTFFFNAQFFGADVASLLPQDTPPLTLIAELLALLGGAWSIGYVWTALYNRWAS